MSRPSPNGNERPWDFPDCPECESEVFVCYSQGKAFQKDYSCELCGCIFDND